MRMFLSVMIMAVADCSSLYAGIQAAFYASPTGSGSLFSDSAPGSLTSVRDKVRAMDSGVV